MKILLLSVSSRTFYYDQLVLPFGLCALGAYVKEDGHTIQGIEMNGPPGDLPPRYLEVDQELLDRIRGFAPDLVAMSTYAANIHNVLFWAQVIKRACPQTTVSVGGNHASYIAREIIETCRAVDIVLRFEGEKPFKALCDQLAAGKPGYEGIPNATFRRGEEIIETEDLPLLPSLDDLPQLDRSLFDSKEDAGHDHADVISARGCPFHCTFCNCNHYWQKRYRMVSVDRVLEELTNLKRQQPALRTVRFRDEAISINRRHCIELCEHLTSSGLGLEYHAHSRLDGLDAEVISNLARAGFRQLFVGLESGSQAVLDRLHKGIKIDRVHELMPAFRKHGLKPRFSLMLGTPGESLEESRETLDLVCDLDLEFDEFYFGHGIVIYPGTTECEKFLERYPNYRWLEPQALSHGYSQQCDQKGNPLAVWHHGAQYDKRRLDGLVNERLSSRLGRHGERDYDVLMACRARTNRSVKKAGGVEAARKRLETFLQIVDKGGDPWVLTGEGYFYTTLLGDHAGGRYQHSKGWGRPGNVAGARSFVVAFPEKSRRLRLFVGSLSWHVLLQGRIYVADRLLGKKSVGLSGEDQLVCASLSLADRLKYKISAVAKGGKHALWKEAEGRASGGDT